ncbi:MAG: hypothetical protein IIU16_03505 [Bacteroidales bacterium]|nr:hypothetical protein [Bacteroidales bacterium]
MKRFCILLTLIMCLSGVAEAQDKIMAMGYLGFRDAAATPENFRRLADAGLDMITLEMDQPGAQMQLDMAHDAGLKILAVLAPYTDHKRLADVDFAMVDSLVVRFRNHPALYGWHICDEPNIDRIPDLKAIKDRIEALDADHPVYINLCPLGSMRALGTDFYRDYIETFVRDCNMKLLSYDCYPAMDYGIIEWWNLCNEAVLNVTRKYGVPFWGFAATCWIDREGQNNMHAKPTLENVRLTVNTHLAYGAQVMQYFTIRDFGGTSWAPLMYDTEWTEAYDVLKAANLEMKRREKVFAGGQVVKTRFTRQVPFACQPLVAGDLPEAIASIESDRSALVSIIENKGSLYVVVVSTSPDQATDVSVDFALGVDMIDNAGNVISQAPGTRSFDLPAGDMLVFKCR